MRRARLAAFEEESGVEVVGEVHQEAEVALVDLVEHAQCRLALVLRGAALALADLEEDVGRVELEYLGDDAQASASRASALAGSISAGAAYSCTWAHFS